MTKLPSLLCIIATSALVAAAGKDLVLPSKNKPEAYSKDSRSLLKHLTYESIKKNTEKSPTSSLRASAQRKDHVLHDGIRDEGWLMMTKYFPDECGLESAVILRRSIPLGGCVLDTFAETLNPEATYARVVVTDNGMSNGIIKGVSKLFSDNACDNKVAEQPWSATKGCDASSMSIDISDYRTKHPLGFTSKQTVTPDCTGPALTTYYRDGVCFGNEDGTSMYSLCSYDSYVHHFNGSTTCDYQYISHADNRKMPVCAPEASGKWSTKERCGGITSTAEPTSAPAPQPTPSPTVPHTACDPFVIDALHPGPVSCIINLCEGQSVILSTCDGTYGGVYSGDTTLTLYANGTDYVSFSDDYLGRCSQISYTSNFNGCMNFDLQQSCFSTSSPCSGTTAIYTGTPI